MAKEAINPESLLDPIFYSHAVKTGNTIYLAGVAGADEEANVAEGDIQAQGRQIFENMKKVLEAAGATLADIVKMNIYCTDMELADDLVEVYLEYFQPPYPAMFGAQVSRFMLPEMLVEMDAIAVVE